MKNGLYSAGEAAKLFLLRRLQVGPVPVSQLLADAEREGIARRTLYRVRRRLGLVNRRAWALPAAVPQQATVEAEEQAVAVEAQRQAAAAETDPRVDRAVAEVSKLIAEGLGRDIAIHRTCRDDPELRAQVEAVLGKR